MKRNRHHLRRIRWLIIPLALILLLPTAAQAQSKTLFWERYDVDITVQTNGDMLVEETQIIQFTSGSFTYGYRTIPMGKTEGIEDVQVWEENRQYTQSWDENPFTFSIEDKGNDLVVYWYFPQTTGTRHTFTFRYTVKGGLKINESKGDSVFWKAIPPDHGFPIKASRTTIHFPAGVEFGDMVTFGTEAESSIENNTVTFVATRAIPAGQEMEVGVAFKHGLIQAEKPDWQVQEERSSVLNLALGFIGALIAVAGLVGVLLLWYLRGKDPEVGLVAEYLSEPPSDVRPGVAGTLVDERADLQDVIATLVDLARRGYLDMVEAGSSGGLFGLGSGSAFDFRKTSKPWDDLLSFEQTLLNKVFGGHAQRSMSDLKNKFYTAIPQIKKGLYKQTVEHKFFRTDPDTVRGRYAGLGIGLLVVAAGIGFFAFSLLVESAGGIICPFIAVGLVSVAVIIVGQAMPVKTRHGAEESAKWKAFKRYLRDIERYTNLEEATDQFDRFLPYAIAFGLERSWINKFSAVPSTPMPIWYHPVWIGSHHSGRRRASSGSLGSSGRGAPSLDGMSKGMATGLAGMSAGLTSMLNTASSTLTSRPQSSGSSGGGWSGGGFSSGGGGGGGSAGFG